MFFWRLTGQQQDPQRRGALGQLEDQSPTGEGGGRQAPETQRSRPEGRHGCGGRHREPAEGRPDRWLAVVPISGGVFRTARLFFFIASEAIDQISNTTRLIPAEILRSKLACCLPTRSSRRRQPHIGYIALMNAIEEFLPASNRI